MALWLQCQEAILLQQAFLNWLDTVWHGLNNLVVCSDLDLGTDSKTSEAEFDPGSQADSNKNLRTVESLKRNKITYAIQVANYPAYPHQTVEHSEVAHGASNFVHTLQEFLSQHIPENPIQPGRQDRFDIYKQVVITAPTLPPVGKKPQQWCLRATPAGTSALDGRKTAAPAHFDMVLVKTHKGGNDEPGQTLLQGQILVLQRILVALRLTDVLYNRFTCCSSMSNIYPSAAIWAVFGSSSLC